MLGQLLRNERVRRGLLTLAALAMLAHLGVVLYWRTHRLGDFGVNREFGRRFLAGESLYAGGACYNYMPVSGLYWAPLALVSPAVGTVARYAVAMVCLALILRWLAAMVRPRCDETRWNGFEVAAIAIVLASHYLIRDLDDGGPNLVYLAMIVGGVYAAWRGRDWTAAAAIGGAVALKMTPALFVPYFLWKRRWRLAFATCAFTALWIASPAVWMGPVQWWNEQRAWNAMARSVAHDTPDLTRQDNETRVQNQALRPAVEAYLTPNVMRGDATWNMAIVNLPPALADRWSLIACGALFALFLAWAWRPFEGMNDPAWPIEAGGVLILTLLFSPVTWLQHVVFLLPALYLIVAQDRARGGLPRWASLAMYGYLTIALVLNREVLGSGLYYNLLAAHAHTLAMLVVLSVLMACRPTCRDKASAAEVARTEFHAREARAA